MDAQAPSTVLMVRPAHFGFNPLTASSNAFQRNDIDMSMHEIQSAALKEFDGFVDRLLECKVDVIVIEDSKELISQDAVFPNNWISFHHDGTVVLYPMLAANRRLERREDILLKLQNNYHFQINNILDLSSYEMEGRFLEGTGSIVFDYGRRTAYANYSQRTDELVVERLCEEINYKKITFPALDVNGIEIYHTNVMMCIGDNYVVICLDAIPDESSRIKLIHTFEASGKEVIEINFHQMEHFTGNMIEVLSQDKEPVLIMSESAFLSLGKKQKKSLSKYADLVYTPLKTIEKYGGGSARCMIAGVFLPRNQ